MADIQISQIYAKTEKCSSSVAWYLMYYLDFAGREIFRGKFG